MSGELIAESNYTWQWVQVAYEHRVETHVDCTLQKSVAGHPPHNASSPVHAEKLSETFKQMLYCFQHHYYSW
ncbi:hypothetical protein Y1Q_0005947 [Alligator mississippiensis]|uniref:Uncharacterized protein n=1 Tax=Alligator mississippiensis TaxID=8496 RepID=A0A151P591_ALLMI|nr:hypothetical protein Y1Q_0005947 [Alligator mississippiensis]